MQLTAFAFAALASVVAAAEWPTKCKYTDGVACYRYCAVNADGTYKLPTEKQALCSNADPRNSIERDPYEYSRVHMRLPLSSDFAPQHNTEEGEANDPWQFDDRCFCFRPLTEDEIGKASPVSNMKDNVCQYHSIRCLRKVELGDVSNCAESYFRCKEQKDADGSDTRATALRAELCQRFKDINFMYTDAIEAVTNVNTDDLFTPEDKNKKLAALEGAKKEFDTRREVSCEGKNANGTPVKDPKVEN
ncbi:hypothetical protein K457DRAFT_22271 [Linnemannia elongata AG-77]|uniref:Extracellular membrane protein CFEM domain-containing protein n=1 Tax=Linnemannia elongata AG-77 TaxID=1314771 RepID=A0A197JPB8_9FUNG|nr:hypothetical protein K457DRAFT_22271 [Linnemannia elongata AG-77]